MTIDDDKPVLAARPPEAFFGRRDELDKIVRFAEGLDHSQGLLLLSAPGTGASELLKQAYNRLFRSYKTTVPVYFQSDYREADSRDAGLRFLHTFLTQTVAFRRNDASIITSVPSLAELVELSVPADREWIEQLINKCAESSGDPRAFLRKCFGSALAAAANGVGSFVMIDDLHESNDSLAHQLAEIFSSSELPFLFAARRRYVFPALETARMTLEPLSFAAAGELIEFLAGKYGIKLNDETRDLIAVQTRGNSSLIYAILLGARASGVSLDSFQCFGQIYADEIFGRRIARRFDDIFARVAKSFEHRKNILSILHELLDGSREKLPAEAWHQRLGTEYARALEQSNLHEVIRFTSGDVEPMAEDIALTDYIVSRFRLEIAGDKRALVFGESLREYISRAPHLMARFYREMSAAGLRELMTSFQSQPVPLALIDYGKFVEDYKGRSDAEIEKSLRSDPHTIDLPSIVFAAHTADFYEPIAMVTERVRSAVGFGFDDRFQTDANKIVWIAAEIDSKLEASRDLAAFWCDRLEMAAVMCGFTRFKMWLITPEGFSPEALEVLQRRDAYGSSRRQIELLKQFLEISPASEEAQFAHEYEIVVPMGGEAELIAAHAVEEIAKRHNFDAKAINQIKTALVEACINASEHSLSPDRKIHQKFSVGKDRIVITISNRGLRLTDKPNLESAENKGRRGWGINLMRRLMDEVRIENVDDGTSISMTKFMKTH